MTEKARKKWNERLVKDILDIIVLHLLRKKPMWGWEIIKTIRNDFRVYLNPGTLYPLLYSLEDRGYIEGEWDSERRRRRRVYKITGKGLEFRETGERSMELLMKKLQTAE